MKKEFNIGKRKVRFVASRYKATNGIFISAFLSENDKEFPGENWSNITICIPELKLGEDEVIIPTFYLTKDTNKVVMENLVDVVVKDVHYRLEVCKLVKLKSNWRDIVDEMD